MMHNSSLVRMEWFVREFLGAEGPGPAHPGRRRVLDVGSYDVNGSYRQFFPSSRYDYVGLDMAPGPNVDVVPASPYRWKEIGTDTFDVVISGQVLEHAEFFWLTVSEMVRVLKKGGIVCIIAPNGFDEHRYPVDCYRFFADGMVALARYTGLEVIHAHTDCQPSSQSQDWHVDGCEDSLLIARKPYAGDTALVDVETYRCTPADLAALRRPLVVYERPAATGLVGRAYRKLGRVLGIQH
jgi:SAM-dependent methyltransferase